MLPTSSLLSLSGQFYLTTYLLGPLEPHIALPFFIFFLKKTFSYYVYSVLPEHIPAHQKRAPNFFFHYR